MKKHISNVLFVVRIYASTSLRSHPAIFKAMTSLYVHEFEQPLQDIQPRLAAAEHKRLSRLGRKRAIGAGHPFDLPQQDEIVLTVVWLRCCSIREVLGYLFGVGGWTASRLIERVLPLLEVSGRDSMRMPNPGKMDCHSYKGGWAATPYNKAFLSRL